MAFGSTHPALGKQCKAMGIVTIYDVLRSIVECLSRGNHAFPPLPDAFDPEASIRSLGLDQRTLPPILEELRVRLEGRDVRLDLSPEDFATLRLKPLILKIHAKIKNPAQHPVVVYVDDEEENLFVFKRWFGKELNLATFTSSPAALAYIRSEASVGLVITDEVMPELSGNALCTAVHRFKPFLKFILITGNPNQDQDLLYNSLRYNRFYEFLSKPLDFQKQGKEYLALIKSLVHGEE